MILRRLKDYLDREQVYYAVIRHPHAGSAQEVAAAWKAASLPPP